MFCIFLSAIDTSYGLYRSDSCSTHEDCDSESPPDHPKLVSVMDSQENSKEKPTSPTEELCATSGGGRILPKVICRIMMKPEVVR